MNSGNRNPSWQAGAGEGANKSTLREAEFSTLGTVLLLGVVSPSASPTGQAEWVYLVVSPLLDIAQVEVRPPLLSPQGLKLWAGSRFVVGLAAPRGWWPRLFNTIEKRLSVVPRLSTPDERDIFLERANRWAGQLTAALKEMKAEHIAQLAKEADHAIVR